MARRIAAMMNAEDTPDSQVRLICWDCCGVLEPHPEWKHRVECPWCGLTATREHAESMQDYWPWTVTSGPWPERIGMRARIVGQHGRMVYPWVGLVKSGEVVIAIRSGDGQEPYQDGWSCVLSKSDLTLADAP
jgi:hypothetical protein